MAGSPTQISRGASSAARRIAAAAGSGWHTAPRGRCRRGISVRDHSSCGVLTAGSCTMLTRTALRCATARSGAKP